MPRPIKYGGGGLETARDRIHDHLVRAYAPGATFLDQAHSLRGVVRELRRSGVTLRAAKDLLSLTLTTQSSPEYRAAYLVNAAHRVSRDISLGTRRTEALDTERRHYHNHVTADRGRNVAALQVQAARDSYGPVIGWYSRQDERVTTECRAAHGKNLDLRETVPDIGYPGLGPHHGCRCRPGPPHPGGELLMTSTGTKPDPIDRYVGRVLELARSSSYPGLARVPGKQNWIEHLPASMRKAWHRSYMYRVAKHIHYEQGVPIGRAIAMAKSTTARWARGGGDVSAKTQAKASKDIALWSRMRAASGKGSRSRSARAA